MNGVYELSNMYRLAGEVLGHLRDTKKQVLLLSGELGAGKTTLVQELGKLLDITDPVRSPTYALVKTYPLVGHHTWQQMMHLDLYRLDGTEAAAKELALLGVDFTVTDTLFIIEWPEQVGELKNLLQAANKSYLHLHLQETPDPDNRQVDVLE